MEPTIGRRKITAIDDEKGFGCTRYRYGLLGE